MATNMKTFTFESDTNITRKIEKFKGKKGMTYRFGFPFLPGIREKGKDFSFADMTPKNQEDEKSCVALAPQWVGHFSAYVPDVGYILCDDPEIRTLVAERTEAKPKMRVGTVICSYPLDAKGNVDFDRIRQDPETVEIKPFIIDTGKYNQIKDFHAKEDYYLWNNDIKSSLDPDAQETFQKWTFAVPKQSAAFSVLRKLLEKVYEGTPQERASLKPVTDNLLTRIQYVIDNELVQVIGREITVQQLKEKLGFAKPSNNDSSSVDVSTDEDVEATLESLNLGL